MGFMRLPLAMLLLAMPAAAASVSMPEFLTWKELQARPVPSQRGCNCSLSNGLEGLVKAVGGELCLPKPGQKLEELSTVNASICYPPDYGVGDCRMWDAGTGSCATEKPEPWCFHFWCYVDPLDCDRGDISASVFWNKAGLGGGNPYFSYMTCGVPSEENPHFNLWMPPHLVAAAIAVGVLVPVVAFCIGYVIARYFPKLSSVALPWMLLWITVTVERVIAILGFHTRIPHFAAQGTTDDVFEAFTLLFMFWCLLRCLDLVDEILNEMRFTRHAEHSASKAMQILESVLLYKTLQVHGWADMLTEIWRPFYSMSRVALIVIWVLKVLNFKMLSDLVIGGFVSTFFLVWFGTLFSMREDLVAAVLLGCERPFKVADIISLHNCRNNESVMSAIAVGFVEKFSVMHVGIRNFDMRLQYVPTREFAKGTIKNWSAREYKTSSWKLWLSMRSSPEAVKAFTNGAEKILKSHPSCKADGYVKVCQKTIRDGGFEVEVICFTKPHADHHAFRMDMSTAFSKLASRLGLEFVFSGVTRETSQCPAVPGFQYAGAGADSKADADVKDLLFQGRFTRGNLIGKFQKCHDLKLAKGFKQELVDAVLSYDVMFEVPLTSPVVIADKAINWTQEHPMLKGELTVMVDSGTLSAIMPHLSMLGGQPKEVFVVAIVAKKHASSASKGDNGVALDASAGSAKLGDLTVLHCAGEEVLACCKTSICRVTKHGDATWGETLHLGGVDLQRPPSSDASSVVLRLVVGHVQRSGVVELLGAAEKPLLELVMIGWQDQRVKVEGVLLQE